MTGDPAAAGQVWQVAVLAVAFLLCVGVLIALQIRRSATASRHDHDCDQADSGRDRGAA